MIYVGVSSLRFTTGVICVVVIPISHCISAPHIGMTYLSDIAGDLLTPPVTVT